LIFLKALPYNAKEMASSIVDLPAPFSPRIRVDLLLSSGISVHELPVDNMFLKRISLK
jgi:hypothetical protein